MSSLNKKPQEIIKVSWFPKDLDLVKFKTNNKENSFFDSLAWNWANEEYKKAVRLNVLDKFLSKLQNGIVEKTLGPSGYTPKETIKKVKKKIKEEKNIQKCILKYGAGFIFPNDSDIREIMVFFKKDPNIRYRVFLNKGELKLKPDSLYFTIPDLVIQYLISMIGKAWCFSLITKNIEDLNTDQLDNIERQKICDRELEKLSYVSSKALSDPYEILKNITYKYPSPTIEVINLVCDVLKLNILVITILEKNDTLTEEIISSPENDYIILFYNEKKDGVVIYESGGIIDKNGKIERKLNIKTHKDIIEMVKKNKKYIPLI